MESLSSSLRAFMRGSLAADFPPTEADSEFNRLALALFVFQRENVPIYRQLCERRKVDAALVRHWMDIPALPTSAFKEFELSSIPESERTRVFHSSGTTGQAHSRHFHSAETLAVYEASLEPWFERHFFKFSPAPVRMIFLTPESAPNSSLIHMFETVRGRFGAEGSAFTGRIGADGGWELDLEKTMAALESAVAEKQPIGLLGTAFSFVHLLDHLQAAGRRIALPKNSRIMETGGYKGRSREVPKAALRKLITKFLNVPTTHILAEYGMSESSSQAYDDEAGVFHFPPWARAVAISPENGKPVESGETGLLRIFDLANVGSIMAMQTEDLAIQRANGFELLGRAPAAEPRGCSLMPSATFAP